MLHARRCNPNLMPTGNVTQHMPLTTVLSSVTVSLLNYNLSTFDATASAAFVAALDSIPTFATAVRASSPALVACRLKQNYWHASVSTRVACMQTRTRRLQPAARRLRRRGCSL